MPQRHSISSKLTTKSGAFGPARNRHPVDRHPTRSRVSSGTQTKRTSYKLTTKSGAFGPVEGRHRNRPLNKREIHENNLVRGTTRPVERKNDSKEERRRHEHEKKIFGRGKNARELLEISKGDYGLIQFKTIPSYIIRESVINDTNKQLQKLDKEIKTGEFKSEKRKALAVTYRKNLRAKRAGLKVRRLRGQNRRIRKLLKKTTDNKTKQILRRELKYRRLAISRRTKRARTLKKSAGERRLATNQLLLDKALEKKGGFKESISDAASTLVEREKAIYSPAAITLLPLGLGGLGSDAASTLAEPFKTVGSDIIKQYEYGAVHPLDVKGQAQRSAVVKHPLAAAEVAATFVPVVRPLKYAAKGLEKVIPTSVLASLGVAGKLSTNLIKKVTPEFSLTKSFLRGGKNLARGGKRLATAPIRAGKRGRLLRDIEESGVKGQAAHGAKARPKLVPEPSGVSKGSTPSKGAGASKEPRESIVGNKELDAKRLEIEDYQQAMANRIKEVPRARGGMTQKMRSLKQEYTDLTAKLSSRTDRFIHSSKRTLRSAESKTISGVHVYMEAWKKPITLGVSVTGTVGTGEYILGTKGQETERIWRDARDLATGIPLDLKMLGEAGIAYRFGAFGGDSTLIDQIYEGLKETSPVALALQGRFEKAMMMARKRPLSAALELTGVGSLVGRIPGTTGRAIGGVAGYRAVVNDDSLRIALEDAGRLKTAGIRIGHYSTQRRAPKQIIEGSPAQLGRRYSPSLPLARIQRRKDKRAEKKLSTPQQLAQKQLMAQADLDNTVAMFDLHSRAFTGKEEKFVYDLFNRVSKRNSAGKGSQEALYMISSRILKSPGSAEADLAVYIKGLEHKIASKPRHDKNDEWRKILLENLKRLQEIPEILKHPDLWKAAAEFKTRSDKLQEMLIDGNLITAEQAAMAHWIPYMHTHMGAKMKIEDGVPVWKVPPKKQATVVKDTRPLEERIKTAPRDRERDEVTELVSVKELDTVKFVDRNPEGGYTHRTRAEMDEFAAKVHAGEKGYSDPVIIGYNPDTGRISLEEGNHRLQVYKEAGLEWIPARVYRSGREFTGGGSKKVMNPINEYVVTDFKPSEVGLTTRPYAEDAVVGVAGSGKALTLEEVKAHAANNGVDEEPAFIAMRPADPSFYEGNVSEGPVGYDLHNTAALLEEGTFDMTSDILTRQVIRARRNIDKQRFYDYLTERYGYSKPNGKTWASYKSAQNYYNKHANDYEFPMEPMTIRIKTVESKDLKQLDIAPFDDINKVLEEALASKVGDAFILVPKFWKKRLQGHIDQEKLIDSMFRKLNREFKGSVLPFSPKWHIGNLVDMTARLLMDGAMPWDLTRGLKIMQMIKKTSPEMYERVLAEIAGGHLTSARRSVVDRSKMPAYQVRQMDAADRILNYVPIPNPWTKSSLLGKGYRRLQQGGFALSHYPELAARITGVGKESIKLLDDMGENWWSSFYYSNALVERITLRLTDPNSNAVKQLGIGINKTLGDYTNLSPTMKRLVNTWTPFGLWARASAKWVLTLPAQHPIKIGFFAAVNRTTEKERQQWGLNLIHEGKKVLPDFMQGSIPWEDELIRTQQYTSLGPWYDFLHGGIGFIAPEFTGLYSIFNGFDYKGDEIKNKDGTRLTTSQSIGLGISSLTETMFYPLSLAHDFIVKGQPSRRSAVLAGIPVYRDLAHLSKPERDWYRSGFPGSDSERIIVDDPESTKTSLSRWGNPFYSIPYDIKEGPGKSKTKGPKPSYLSTDTSYLDPSPSKKKSKSSSGSYLSP